jgi:hypothetical protein
MTKGLRSILTTIDSEKWLNSEVLREFAGGCSAFFAVIPLAGEAKDFNRRTNPREGRGESQCDALPDLWFARLRPLIRSILYGLV